MFRSIQKKIRARYQSLAMRAIVLAGAASSAYTRGVVEGDKAYRKDSGRKAAFAWMERSFQLGVVSSLPRDEKGNVIWPLAGPMMFRELPTITFALIYATGLPDAEAEALAKQILNEWHGLEKNAGLESDFGPADLKEAK